MKRSLKIERKIYKSLWSEEKYGRNLSLIFRDFSPFFLKDDRLAILQSLLTFNMIYLLTDVISKTKK